jgi:hypothetical protein
MKKYLLLISIILFSFACSKSNTDFRYSLLPVDSAITPSSFVFGKTDTIKVKYTLPNACYSFFDVYYDYQQNARVIAIQALKDTESLCAQVLVQKEVSIPIKPMQKENYVFKFWKGKDTSGNDTFEEVVVTVK